MATQITNHKCLNCTGPLRFDGKLGKLKCDYCGSEFEPAAIEAAYAEREQKATEAFEKDQAQKTENAESAQAAAATGEHWDSSAMSEEWGDEANTMSSYACASCGAEIICDKTTAATSCLYCGNATVIPGQFSGMIKPDYVIPFELSKQDAIDALKKHYEGKFLLPKLFKSENHLDEIKGVYVPFWLFDGSADADITYKATKSVTVRQGDYNVTTTSHFNVRRAGTVSFDKIPVDASSKMPDVYMESIEPFDYSDLKPFSTAYMPGYLADKYDVSIENCSPRADQRAENSAIETMQSSVGGYTTCIPISKNVNLKRGQVKYVLAPVWLLNTRWKDKTFLFAMNGQTGKMVGDLPCDNGKLMRLSLAVFAGVFAVSTLIAFLV